MDFVQFRDKLQEHITTMVDGVDYLLEVEVDKEEMWNLYLDSFPEGTNQIFRERRVHDCNECKSFFRSFGNVVAIKDMKMVSVWDIDLDDSTFGPVVKALSNYIHARPVKDVFMPRSRKMGVDKNIENTESGTITWYHLYYELPKRFRYYPDRLIANSNKSIIRDIRNVYYRGLNEITNEAIDTVLELIHDNSLYRGDEWELVLEKYKACKEEFDQIPEEDKDSEDHSDTMKSLYAWNVATIIDPRIGKIRSTSMGTLLLNLSQGMDLELAVNKFEEIVAPENYRRSKPIYTKKMLDDAKKKVEELGYTNSLHRRFATIDDISVQNILFANRDIKQDAKEIDDLFASMEKDIAVSPKKFEQAKEVSIDNFIKDILPTVSNMEVLMEGRLSSNLVSLITAKDEDAKSMFKWNNPFSWAYSGNITDSSIKENVKSAGGKVDGVLRFSIQWNDGNEWDRNDLDAHCIEPNGNEIFFCNAFSYYTGGSLDIDIQRPENGKVAVENITWPSIEDMHPGTYRFFVENYAYRGGQGGFRAEIEFNGDVHQYDYPNVLRNKERVDVAIVQLFHDGHFDIKSILPDNISSREIWGIKTNQFIPVTLAMYSPNYWDEQAGIGNKHFFFMLNGCVNDENPNGFFNEYLKSELTPYRKVFEALGSRAHVVNTPNQLSGLGFSSTRRNNLIVRADGKVYKVKF